MMYRNYQRIHRSIYIPRELPRIIIMRTIWKCWKRHHSASTNHRARAGTSNWLQRMFMTRNLSVMFMLAHSIIGRANVVYRRKWGPFPYSCNLDSTGIIWAISCSIPNVIRLHFHHIFLVLMDSQIGLYTQFVCEDDDWATFHWIYQLDLVNVYAWQPDHTSVASSVLAWYRPLLVSPFEVSLWNVLTILAIILKESCKPSPVLPCVACTVQGCVEDRLLRSKTSDISEGPNAPAMEKNKW